MTGNVLLIDGNWVVHSRAGQGFSNSDGFVTAGIYGFYQSLRKQLRERDFDSVVVAFDGGRSDRRKDILETYKDRDTDGGDSKSRANDVLKQISVLDGDLLEASSIHSVRIDGKEGDDIIAVISEIVESCTIYSADKDFIQLVDDSTSLVKKTHGGESLVDNETFEEEWEFDTEDHLLYLALKGDSSDAIAGVEGVGDKRAADLVREHGNLDDIIEACEGEDAKYRQAIAESKDLVKRNKKLIDLSLEKFDDSELKYIYKKLNSSASFDKDKFVEIFESLEFNSFLDTVDQWEQRLSQLQSCNNFLKPQDEVEDIMKQRLS